MYKTKLLFFVVRLNTKENVIREALCRVEMKNKKKERIKLRLEWSLCDKKYKHVIIKCK